MRWRCDAFLWCVSISVPGLERRLLNGSAHGESAPVPPNVAVSTPLVTTAQAAEYLQVSVRTMKNLMSEGQIAYIKIGRVTRIHRHDLDEYIARNRRKQRNGLRAS